MKSTLRRLTRRRRPARQQPPRGQFLEQLEARQMMDANDIISVGRTLSAWTTADIENNQLKITYSVYNQQSKAVKGVLLSTTLQPGVEFVNASIVPNQNGQELAWSFGTLAPFSCASVEVTVSFDGAIPLQLDGGAEAFGTLTARAVSDDAPAAMLRSGSINAALLASTPDANTNDPFIQAKAAQLDYDPNQIFAYLTDEVGYESYNGSLRGARGTLWSSAGNALDEASLGVALMRASGIPARYVEGTLSDPSAKQLILSMFPDSHKVVGHVPAGEQVADPANDPKLLAETRNHFWFQFDTGGGFINADTTFASATVGQTFTASDGTFAEVPDAMRHKVQVTLTAETWNAASAAFGLGDGLGTKTVFNETFNAVDLVGRTVSIGNLVDQSGISAVVISSRTTTYTPFVIIADEALLPGELPDLILGTSYQEVLTNFPFGSQVLTGFFVDLELTAPDGQSQVYDRALYDRIGYAARQGLVSPNVTVDPSGPPALTTFDTWNLKIQASQQSEAATRLAEQFSTALFERLTSGESFAQALQTDALMAQARAILASFALISDREAANLARGYSVAAYFDAPRIAMFSSKLVTVDDESTLSFGMDLIEDSIRAVAAAGQNAAAPLGFAAVRGIFDSYAEAQAVPVTDGGTNVSSAVIIGMSVEQGIPLISINAGNLGLLQTLDLPAEAKARITANVQNGLEVVVPARSITINGEQTTAWWVGDPATGEVLSQGQAGGFGANSESAAIYTAIYAIVLNYFVAELSNWAADFTGNEKLRTNLIKAVAFSFLTVENLLLQLLINNGIAVATSPIGPLQQIDPPLSPVLVDLDVPYPDIPTETSSVEKPVSANQVAGQVNGSLQTPSLTASGQLTATWDSSTASAFRTSSLSATGATVTDSNGVVVGSGAIALDSELLTELSISGNTHYSLNGIGSLSFYGAAGSDLGVSGDWESFSANVTGSITILLTTDGLILNGQTLPAGTYTITTNAATLAGSGTTSSPQYSGSASLTTTNSVVKFGPATGSADISGNAINLANGATLTGFTGTIAVGAEAGASDSVTLDGVAAHILNIAGSPSPISTDQNTPQTVAFALNTSLTGNYTLTADAPDGWKVEVDADGNVTITPKPGVQSGTFKILLTARSTTNSELVAQREVSVTIDATLPGVDLDLEFDPIFFVDYFGAQVPTAYRATIRNLGPQTDTFDLTFPDVPPGFEVLGSKTSVTIPAGETAIVGLYLSPTGVLPAPGTLVSFGVTATSSSDSGITQTQTINFEIPEIHGVTLDGDPARATTTPGTGIDAEIVVTARGNVPETVTFTVDASTGLTVDGLHQVTLNPGEQIVLHITLTPAAGVPLNSTLSAKITATFGGNLPVALTIPVYVAAPGVESISEAATSARKLGELDLAARLDDLGIALTNLTQDPLSEIYKSQAVANLDSILSLLTVDPLLAGFVDPLSTARTELVAANTPSEIESAVHSLADALENFAEIIGALARSNMQVQITPNTQVAQPGVPQTFQVVVQNIGTETSTYNFAAAGLPAGVSSQFDNPSVTIDPGQFATVTLTLTQDNPEELAAFNFQVDVSIDGVTPAITKSVNGSLTVRNEFVKVVDVQTDVSFTNPGGVVAVSTRLLNAVNRRQNALLSYEVFNANGDSVFTSSAVAAQLTVQTTLADVNLGSFNTTGYALGNYRIVVTVTDEFGAPIPGATGEALLLVGTPVKATLDVSQNDLLPGTRTITNTLQIDSSTPLGDAFDLIGQATSAGSTNAIRHGDFVYVATPNGLQVFDISGANINNPQLVRTIGQAVFTLKIHNDMLVTASAGNSSRVDIYSLTDPSDPQLLGSTGVLPYGSASSMVITDTHVYVVMINVIYWLGSNDVFDMNGSVVAINIEDPTMPYLDGDAITAQGTAAGRDGVNDGVLFNANGTNTDGIKVIGGIDQSGGNHNTWDIKQVSPTIVLVTGSSATGTDTQTGVGQVYVVDISDPSNMFVVRTLDIPGTVHAFGLAIDGDVALLTATEGGLQDFAAGTPFTGRVVLATLDIGDPENPSIINTKILDDLARGVTFPAALGNGLFAMGTDGTGDGSKIYLIDATDPANLFLGVNDAPAVRPTAADGGNNLILTTDGSSLIIYQAQATPAIPVTAQVQVPTGTGVTIVPGSFNIPPTQIIAGVGFDTLVWDLALTAGNDSITITWETTVTDIKPAESRDVTLDTTIDFEENGTPGQIVLPPQTVAARHIIEIVPDEQIVQPGQTVIYGVSLSNPTNASVTYDLAVAGIPQEWVNLVSQVTLPAFGFVNVPLFVSPDIFAVLGDYGFVVTATAAGGTDSVQGLLTVEGDPIVPPADPLAHGVVVELTPIGVAAGQGTAAHYVVRLTNTGSEAENYNLSLSGLPAGFTVAFAQSSIVVPPGASNFREIALTIMVPNGATTGDHVFNIDVFSTDSGASDEVFGLVNVSAIGVDVEFMPNSGSPGSVFDLKVTNNSTTTQTFNLSLAGPAALVASLGVNSVTLGPGAFQMVSINVGAIDYAYPGAIDLVAVARSQTNTAVQDSDLASVNITGRLAMTAAFDDDSIQLNQPGTTSFTLLVENLGNLEDQYVAEIISTTGPVTASLIGLDGKPTQSIPLFLLPGLSTGAIVLNANLTSLLPGTITVRIRSLTDNTIVAQDTARIIVPIPDDIGDIIALGSVGGSDVRTRVKVVDPTNDAVIVTFTPYGNSFHGGVRVATADLDKDGVLEIITAPGPGRDPLVKVFDLAGNELLEYRITAYSKSFTGGVYVAVGDIDGDGYLDIITTPGGDMAAEVRVWRNRLNKGDRYEHDVFSSGPYRNFLAFGSTFHGGATVAADDLNGDGRAEVVVGNGPGMAPRIRAFDLRKFKQTATPQLGKHSLEFRPFESTDRGGVFVAAANIRGSVVQIIVGNGVNGRGEVEIYRANGTLQHEFVPYPSGDLNAPVHVSRKNYDGGRLFEILTSQGSPGSSKSWNVWEYDGDLVDEALEEDLDFRHGFFVA